MNNEEEEEGVVVAHESPQDTKGESDSNPHISSASSSLSVSSSRLLTLDPQTDGISAVRYSHNGSHLLITSWDGGATVYSPFSDSPWIRHAHAGAVLCGTFDSTDEYIFTGGLDPAVKMFSASVPSSDSTIGRHEGPVRCLEWIPSMSSVLTGSWDKTARLWDARSPKSEVSQLSLPERVFAMDVLDSTCCFALADGGLHFYDLRSVDAGPITSRPSTLGHQIRCVKFIDRGQGVLAGGIDGRVAVENIMAPIKRYLFKCHRKGDWVFPVNALAVQSISLFATGGADGTVVIWDGMLKKKLVSLPELPSSCAALDYHPQGRHLAVCSSYTFEKGDIAHAPDQVSVVEFT